MSLSTDVNLPRKIEPKWPDRCVCCGRPNPGGTVRVWTASIGWWTVLFWQFGALYSVTVPSCAICAKRLWAMRVAKFVLNCVLAFAGVTVAFWILKSYEGPFRKLLAMVIALVFFLPYVFWETFFPPAFDITCFANTVDFEFRDPAYAAEFESLNRGVSAEG
jgi:hypothetical protein